MAIAIITGSGTHALPGFADARTEPVATPFGAVEVSRGRFAGADVLHVSRHGAGHVRLSHQLPHRADVWALHALGAEVVIGCTVCGAVDPSLQLGTLLVFDDLWYLANSLPDGSPCTFFVEEGDPRRGHWVLHGGPFSDGVRAALVAGAAEAGRAVRDGGTYGHVDGPRFNTPAEIAQLAAAGVSAVSQTGGPETVLCGELELPFALLGYVTDHANEVRPGQPTPVAVLERMMAASTATFAAVLQAAVRRLAAGPACAPAGTMYRFERG
ncbi:MAG: MTAP family purine nucleoside phosphorylase [Solirubrobacteraceae bacterium]